MRLTKRDSPASCRAHMRMYAHEHERGACACAQAAAYNAGAVEVRERVSALMRVNSTSAATFGGLVYADGLSNGAKCPELGCMLNTRGGLVIFFFMISKNSSFKKKIQMIHVF